MKAAGIWLAITVGDIRCHVGCGISGTLSSNHKKTGKLGQEIRKLQNGTLSQSSSITEEVDTRRKHISGLMYRVISSDMTGLMLLV